MKKIFVFVFSICSFLVNGQEQKTQPAPAQMTHEMTEFYTPKPNVVTPGKIISDNILVQPPSDAIILFDGTDLSQWEKAQDRNAFTRGESSEDFSGTTQLEAKWLIENGVMTVNKAEGDIQTKKTFGDFQLHVEWRVPKNITGEGQLRGNSGIFLQGLYEVQVLDSYNQETYVNGQAGSIYKQSIPLVNAMRAPGEWNVYDIVYTAPTFREDGSFRTRPCVTVIHNGVLVQNNALLSGPTQWIGIPQPKAHGKGPIRLQAHGDKSEPISFRNIWIREL